MIRRHVRNWFCVTSFLILALGSGAEAAVPWQSLEAGMDIAVLEAREPAVVGGARITVVRIDPNLWDLEFATISLTGEAHGRTARGWCESHDFVVAINAGMFGTDGTTHVGYMQSGGHTNSSHVNAYQSVAAFDARDSTTVPRFRIFDLDTPGVTIGAILKDYASVVQNLRLIKRPGLNRWSQQEKKWSEAALGEDDRGRILLMFSRSPFSMYDLNRELLAAGIGLVAAQHLEGGPEAQLYLRVGDLELDLVGSYETSFRENDGNSAAWPIPNALGIRRRASVPE